MLDQGVHLIDLARWFAGDFIEVRGDVGDATSGTCRSRTTASLLLTTADGPDRVAARQLHRVEEPVLVRDLRPRRQAADRRPRRQLRRRAADVLPDAAGDGAARDDDLGISRARTVLARRVLPRDRRASAPGRPSGGLDDALAALAIVERVYARWRSRSSRHLSSSEPCRMIITRSPLRISLGGGGTDLPSYYREHSGFLIAGGDRQVRLHHPAPDVRRRPDRQVLEAGARRRRSTTSSTRSSARRCG